MGVDIATYRMRIGCCRHIYGTDVVREIITVNATMATTTAFAVIFLLFATLGLLSNLQHGLENIQKMHLTSNANVAVGTLYSINCLRCINVAFSERLIGAVVFIRLLLLSAGVEPNPGPELKYKVMDSPPYKEDKHFSTFVYMMHMYMIILPTIISVATTYNIYYCQLKKKGIRKKEEKSCNTDDKDDIQTTLSFVNYNGHVNILSNKSRMPQTCYYLLGNKGAHMTNGNPHDEVSESLRTTSALRIVEKKVHFSVGFIHPPENMVEYNETAISSEDEEQDTFFNETRGQLPFEHEDDDFFSINEEEEEELPEIAIPPRGTGFRVGDCYMMTAYHVFRDIIDVLVNHITFHLENNEIQMEDFLRSLCMENPEHSKSVNDVIKTFLNGNAMDIPLLLERLDNIVSEEFKSEETEFWKKNCVVDFCDKDYGKTRFEIDWRIPFGCEKTDVLIVKLLKTSDDQMMPPRLYLANTYEQLNKMFIVRYISSSKPRLDVDKDCYVFKNNDELEEAVTMSVEWWKSTFPNTLETFSYEDCKEAHNKDKGRVIVRAAASFVYGSSGSPVVYFYKKESPAFVGMVYQRGFPVFYYDNEDSWNKKIEDKTGKPVDNKVLFEGCSTLQKVSDLLMKHNKLKLRKNIFDLQPIARQLYFDKVIDAPQKVDSSTEMLPQLAGIQNNAHCGIMKTAETDERTTDLMKKIVEKWEGDEDFFVETKATECITRKLNDSNINILTIVGCAGSGKSSAMHHAALFLKRQGFSLFVVKEWSQILYYNTQSTHSIFVIDDPFGKDKIDKTKLTEWRDNSSYLRPFMTKSVKLVVTIRKEIFASVTPMSDFIFKTEIVDISSEQFQFSPFDRIRYFDEVLCKRKITINPSLNEMIEECEVQNFPQLVHMYCTNEDGYFREHPIQLFIQLLGAFEFRLEEMWDCNKKQFGGLVLCSVNQDELKVESLTGFINHETQQMKSCKILLEALGIPNVLPSIGNELKKLVGIYITETTDYYTFKLEELRNVVLYVVGKKHQLFVLKYCDTLFCLKRCQLTRPTRNIYFSLSEGRNYKTDDKYMITIEIDLEKYMVVKFIESMINCEDLGSNIFESDFCQDEKFLITMYTEIKRPGLYCSIKQKVLLQILCNACLNNIDSLIEKLMLETIDYNENSFTGLTPLAACAYSGKTTELELFMDYGCDTNMEFNRFTPLALAVLNNQITTVDVLSKKCDVNLGYHTPLCTSVLNGDAQIVKLLLDRGAYIHKLDGHRLLPLAYAVFSEKITTLLLKSMEDFDTYGEVDTLLEPLSVACIMGQANIVNILLDNKTKVADIDKIDASGNTALTRSILNGYESIARMLIQREAKINLRGEGEKATTPLCTAIRNGSMEIVKLLIDKDAEINMFCGKGSTPLTWAISENAMDTVNILLDKRADVNKCGSHVQSLTPLTTACVTGSVDIVKLLLAKEADVNKFNGAGRTPLTLAVIAKNLDVITFLLENKNINNNKIDIDMCGDGKQALTPLTAACVIGSEDIMKLLISNEADINKQNGAGFTPLLQAIFKNDIDIVKCLLENNADVNICGDGDKAFTPLTAASYIGSEESMERVLKRGANFNQYDRRGETAVTTASSNGYLDIVERLFKIHADIDKYDQMGRTPLTRAILSNKTDIMHFLLDKDADVNKCGEGNQAFTPLTAASYRGSKDIVEVLVQKNAYINKRDGRGKTPMQTARDRGFEDIVEYLSIDRLDEMGRTRLTRSIFDNNIEEVNLLLKMKADVDICGCGHNAFTPLTAACKKGSEFFVKLMMSNKADIHKSDGRGKTPLETAIKEEFTEIVGLLSVNDLDEMGRTRLTRSILCQSTTDIDFLLDFKADVNICGDDKEAETPLTAASKMGSRDLVDRLLNNGASINKYNGNGKTPLAVACSRDKIDIVNILLDNNADVNMCGVGLHAMTPLTACHSHVHMLDFLLSKGAGIDRYDGMGVTALTSAILFKNIDSVNFLLVKNANVNACGDGVLPFTPLTAASNKGLVDVAELLLIKGAIIDKCDGCGMTPLTGAVFENNIDVIRLLIDKNADVNITGIGKLPLTPLTAASQKGFVDIVKLLLDKGAYINKRDGGGLTALNRVLSNNRSDIIRLLENNTDV